MSEFTLHVRSYVSTSEHLSLEEVARLTNAPRPILEKIIEEGIVPPAETRDERPLFRAEQVREIERSLRLHEDLGVNWAGIAIIRDLLIRLEELQHELDRRVWSEGEVRDTACD